jgi:hypothetical protein
MIDSEPKAAPSPPALDLRWMTHKWTGPVILVISTIVMLVWTWGHYCHPLVDFGRELYVAWRLSAGEVLYRDIDYFNGPLSPYLNALVFRLFGTSLLSLEIANFVWWALLAVMAYRIYAAMSDRLGAFVAMLMFIALFSFLQLNEIGNDNFLTPYSHEITHALTCAFGMLTLLWSYLRIPAAGKGKGVKQLIGCGTLVGLMFLTKVEVMVAAGAALTTGVGLRLISTRAPIKQWLQTGVILIAAALIPLILAFLLLRLNMPAHQALDGVLGSWKYLGDAHITNNPYYRRVLGTDQLQRNIVKMLMVVGCDLLLLLPALVLALSIRHRATNEMRWACALGSAFYVVVMIWIFWDAADWHGAMRPLNLVGITATATFLIAVLRRTKHIPSRLMLQLSFSVFATALVAKTFFNISIFHYGFALSGPVFAVLVLLLICWIPALIHGAGGTGWIFRAAAMAALGGFCAKYLITYETFYRSRPAAMVGNGADAFGVRQDAEAINLTLNFLSHLPADQTIATLPQGAMINYLSRRINPTGEVLLLPGELEMFGEQHILDRFMRHPPDWIVAIQTDVSGFGSNGFGVDYAQSLVHYIKDNYDPVPMGDPAGLGSPIHMMRYDPGHRAMADRAATRPSHAMSSTERSSPANAAAPANADHPR